MHHSLIPHGAAGAACLLLLVAGCGTEPPRLAAVQGKVFYLGLPLRSGTIVFTPDLDRGGRGPLARAEIQADGGYVLYTDDRAGATPGWHRVTLLAVQPPGQGQAISHSLVPRKYSDPDFSGLLSQVKPDQINVIDFNLD